MSEYKNMVVSISLVFLREALLGLGSC